MFQFVLVSSTFLFSQYQPPANDPPAAAVASQAMTALTNVDEASTAPLVGMALLDGYELNVQVRSGGGLTIRSLP
jgi:hypothetical protein